MLNRNGSDFSYALSVRSLSRYDPFLGLFADGDGDGDGDVDLL